MFPQMWQARCGKSAPNQNSLKCQIKCNKYFESITFLAIKEIVGDQDDKKAQCLEIS